METESMWNRVLGILGAAALLGVLADVLLREGPWGLNASLWSFAFAVLLWRLSRGPDTAMPRGRRWCIPFIALFGAMLAWRDAPVLKLLDIAVIFALCATLILRPTVESVLRTGFGHYLTAFFDGAGGIVLGLPSMVTVDIPKGVQETKLGMDESRRAVLTQRLWSASTGILIAIPLVLVFGALFTSADTAFRTWVSDLFNLDWETLFEHILIIGVSTWMAAGYFHVALLKKRVASSPEVVLQGARLDTLSILIPLGALIALFGAFVAVQIPYFFGGNAIVASQTGPSYAEYARQGFFQLVTVAALALAVLLFADWLGRDASPGERRVLHTFTVTLVTLVFVVMASALHRMALYTSVYGLTTLRFYTTAFMFWLAVVMLWFLAVILRGQRERFLFPAIASACACVLVFNAVNPERIIVEVNTTRADMASGTDFEYLATLSADAVPALVAASNRLPDGQRTAFQESLQKQREDLGTLAWRTWSWSRQRAWSALDGK